MKQINRIGLLLLAISIVTATSAMSSDTCDLAQTVAQKASVTFAKDKAEGLKLFIKAKQLCPENGAYAYNLGVAYYQYGRLDEAVSNLEEAVQKNVGNALWMNNLASVLLERKSFAKALEYAEKAAKLSGNSPAVQDTLARSRFANGQGLAAIKDLHAFLPKSSDADLNKTYNAILDGYLSHYLEKIQAGEVDEGLKGLSAADFEPKAVRAHALVLAKSGRGTEALAAASAAGKRFKDNKLIVEARDEIADQVALSLYEDFQKGQGAKAVQRAKGLAEQYPLPPIKQAYNKLLEAFLADASGITVPEAVARKRPTSVSTGKADSLLAGIGSGAAAASADIDLQVDVDQNIPKGQKAGKYDIAVVIGNRDYSKSGTPDVDYAARDARTMREYLVETFGYDPANIIYAEDATYAKFSQIFGSDRDYKGQLYKYVKPKQSNVFVYYVGHGAPDLDSGDAYFIPVDADPQFLKTSGYRLQTFYDNLAKVPAKQMTVVLDACFSGNSSKGLLFKGVSSITLKVKQNHKKPANAVVFASAGDDQVSTWYPEKRHSLFTYYFLKGVQGEADSNRDKKLTVAEMDKYLAENVPYMARRLKGTEQQPTVSGDGKHVLAVLKK